MWPGRRNRGHETVVPQKLQRSAVFGPSAPCAADGPNQKKCKTWDLRTAWAARPGSTASNDHKRICWPLNFEKIGKIGESGNKKREKNPSFDCRSRIWPLICCISSYVPSLWVWWRLAEVIQIFTKNSSHNVQYILQEPNHHNMVSKKIRLINFFGHPTSIFKQISFQFLDPPQVKPRKPIKKTVRCQTWFAIHYSINSSLTMSIFHRGARLDLSTVSPASLMPFSIVAGLRRCGFI